jgi:hypothetical protein
MKAYKPKLEHRAVKDLIPYDNNVKKHDKDQVKKIAEAIRRHGFDVPIVVDRDGVIIKGHGRRLAAIELGLEKVPVLIRDDLSPDQVKAARLADNRVAIGDIDPEMLRIELATLEEDMKGIFDAKELEFMDADLGEVNTGVFVTDMDAVMTEQKADLDARADAAAKSRVAVSKAFGFKDIPATGQLAITKLMAKAESETGLKNEEALIAWAGAL